jgi:hypothetical protein
MAMLGAVLPVIADVVNVDRSICVDVAPGPAHASAPVVTARSPIPERITRAKSNSGPDDTGGDVARLRKIIRRVGRIWPAAIDDGGVVVGHIDSIGRGGLDHNHLLALFFLDSDILLFVRHQLVVGNSLRSQALDRVHYVRLLRQNSVAQLLGPIELLAHQRENGWRCGQ